MKEERRFIFLIGQARQRLTTRLDQALLEAAGITAAQSGALYYLKENDGCLFTELSGALGLDKSAITGLVDRLENKKLVERRLTPADRRAISIVLTDAGRDAANRCLKVTKEFNRAITEGLSEQEIEAFSKILQKIIGKFSK
ncbi:MAG: MarR family transcriptional regulator [Deltaproteobacteria bacterium HGW-Deltaproteobacteria-12]|jgi:DNA-binding MarR family transcriptional regulator|nr:MAG: MarR family transcriptional regulator [Deltaproteobacteria bacterium HGW-Deltaproteobacteria-12]